MVPAGDERWVRHQLTGPPLTGDDHRTRSVGVRRDVVCAKRIGHIVGGEQFLGVPTEGAGRRQRPCRLVHAPESIPARACSAERGGRPTTAGATVYGSVCRVRVRSVLPADGLPNP